MKNFRILLFIVAASLFAACDDAIDIKQPSELAPEDTFETVNDLQLGLNAVYGAVPGETAIVFTSIFTDEVKVGVANGGQGLGDGGLSFVLNANSGDAASIWLSNYVVINYANRLIAGSSNVVVLEDEEPTFNDILAQAYTLRAYAHLTLLSYFSTDMKDDSAPGVIALDFIPTVEQKLPRNTNGEVYALINSDLDFADANLASGPQASRTYVSKDVVLAIRARLAAYRGQYSVAEGFANQIIAKPTYGLTPKGTYNPASTANLETTSPYYRLFRDGVVTSAQNEVIFKLERTVSGDTGNFYQAWSSVNSSTTGGAFFEVSAALFSKLAVDDIRRAVIVDPSSYTTGFTVRPVGKYAYSQGGINLLGDVKVFRTSEMYLIKAEAMASRSDLAGVATQINTIRFQRFGNTSGNIGTPGSVQEAWAAILNERRIELAFEGHRYIDIKRLGVLAGATVDRARVECEPLNACDIDPTDFRFTLPIPRLESSANPSIQQNPGYN